MKTKKTPPIGLVLLMAAGTFWAYAWVMQNWWPLA